MIAFAFYERTNSSWQNSSVRIIKTIVEWTWVNLIALYAALNFQLCSNFFLFLLIQLTKIACMLYLTIILTVFSIQYFHTSVCFFSVLLLWRLAGVFKSQCEMSAMHFTYVFGHIPDWYRIWLHLTDQSNPLLVFKQPFPVIAAGVYIYYCTNFYQSVTLCIIFQAIP